MGLFTSLSVERVRHQQRTGLTEHGLALNETIVRWDTLRPFTLVFTSTDQPIFVYKKLTDVPQTLREYFLLYSQAARESRGKKQMEIFPDYTTLIHEQFFIKLASLSSKYFNKSICTNCYRQYEYACQLCFKCPRQSLIRPSSFDYSSTIKNSCFYHGRDRLDLTTNHFLKHP